MPQVYGSTTPPRKLALARLAEELVKLERRIRSKKPWSRAAACRDLKLPPTTVGEWFTAQSAPADFPPLWKLVQRMLDEVEGPPTDTRSAGRRKLAHGFWYALWSAVDEARQVPRPRPEQAATGQGAELRTVVDPVERLQDHPAIAPPPHQALTATRLGTELRTVDPVRHLEVHPAIAPPDAESLGPLPYYVIRQHDHDLREEVEQARTGNRLVVLIGDASSGKTRALWEAIQALEGWRVWRPADHHALMHGLAESRSLASTVLWLNESQRFLHTTNTADGERAAAALTGLLTDPGRGPVLMVGTLWRKQAHSLMSRHDEEHQQARALLAGGRAITVAESFSDADLEELRLRAPEDARLAEALKHGAARITQYLAGAPELLLLNDRATAEGRAVLDAAADARRLGHSAALFPDFLKAAAAANLQPDLWRSETKEWRTKWFEGAIAYTSQSSRGLPGPLTLELPPPGHVPYEDDAYLLADYLHQHLAKLRCYAVPPPGFWDAAATHISDADDLMALSKAASDRWRLRIARQILLRASDAGHPIAMRQHGILKRQEGDDTTARRLFQQAGDAGDAEALWQMSWLLEDVGKAAAAKTYHDRAAQASNLAELSDRVELRRALEAREDEPQSPPDLDQALALWRSGDLEDAERLLQRTAAAGWKESWRMLADRVAATGDDGGTERLLRRAVDEGDSWALNNLSRMREEKGDLKGAERAFWQAIDAGDVVARDTLIWMKQRSERLSADPQRFRRAIALGNLTYFMGWQPEDNKDYGEEWEQVLEYGLEADGSVSPPWQ